MFHLEESEAPEVAPRFRAGFWYGPWARLGVG